MKVNLTLDKNYIAYFSVPINLAFLSRLSWEKKVEGGGEGGEYCKVFPFASFVQRGNLEEPFSFCIFLV